MDLRNAEDIQDIQINLAYRLRQEVIPYSMFHDTGLIMDIIGRPCAFCSKKIRQETMIVIANVPTLQFDDSDPRHDINFESLRDFYLHFRLDANKAKKETYFSHMSCLKAALLPNGEF